MTESSRREMPPVPPGIALGDPPAAWMALVNDTNCSVMVLDSDGTIYFANENAARLLGHGYAHVIGKRLHDFTTGTVADERIAFIRESIASVRAITVDGMIAGIWRRTTYRPVPTPPTPEGNRPRCLAVARLGSSYQDALRPASVIRAKFDDAGILDSLTKREMEILCLIGEGMSTTEISKLLHRSSKTVEWHRVALGAKLGIANRVELARLAIRAGLVQIDERKVH